MEMRDPKNSKCIHCLTCRNCKIIFFHKGKNILSLFIYKSLNYGKCIFQQDERLIALKCHEFLGDCQYLRKVNVTNKNKGRELNSSITMNYHSMI